MKKTIQYIRNDFSSSLVVFLVALPLCMGIALASGVNPIAGLLAGIIGGLIIGPISGAPLQVSGPAAGLVVIVYGIVEKDGVRALAMATLIGGVIQVAGGLLKKGELFKLIPFSVINGMLMGIGTLILFSQVHMLFDQGTGSSLIENLLALPQTVSHIFSEPRLIVVPIIGFALLYGWGKFNKRAQIPIPAQLICVIGLSLVSLAIPWNVKMVEIADDVFSHIGDGLLITHMPSMSLNIFLDGVVLGLVASAESMLSTSAVKELVPSSKVHYSKELFAQGIGNMVAGFMGALPITGVIVRTTANVDAGGKTKASTIMHGFWLLLFIAFGTALLRHIPMSALAIILVVIGFKLMKPQRLWQALTNFSYDNFILLSTWLGVIFVDLLFGVCLGIGLAVLQAKPVREYLSERTNLF